MMGEVAKFFQDLWQGFQENVGFWWSVIWLLASMLVSRFDILGIDSYLGSPATWVAMFLVVGVVRWLWMQLLEARSRWHKERQAEMQERTLLYSLKAEQKAIILRYLLRNTTTLELLYESPHVDDLVHKGIIRPKSSRSSVWGTQEYTLHPWVRDYFEQMSDEAVDQYFEGSLQNFTLRYLQQDGPDIYASFLQNKIAQAQAKEEE